MPAISRTLAQLFGADSAVNSLEYIQVADAQEFFFPGLSAAFVSALGNRGWIARFSGLLRGTSSTTASVAAQNLLTLIRTIEGYERDGTELNLFVGDSTLMADLYTGSEATNWLGVVMPGTRFGQRAFARSGTNITAIAPFDMVYRILRFA